MILQALYKFYERIPDVAPKGFQYVEIPFVIVIDEDGNFRDVIDTRVGEGRVKRGRKFLVPKAVKRTSKVVPNLLWDNVEYIIGEPVAGKGKDPEKRRERARQKHDSFIRRIEDVFPEDRRTKEVEAVLKFLRENKELIKRHTLWEEMKDTGGNISFQIEGRMELVCQSDAVKAVVSNIENAGESKEFACLVTGNKEAPARLHSPIKGVRGAHSSGANIVSFNLGAFSSYGKKQGYNAPVGESAEFKYTTALNELLKRDSTHKFQVGDATVVFWAEKKHEMEEWFGKFFGEPESLAKDRDADAIKSLFSSPERGVPPHLEDPTKFYVLGLSPFSPSRLGVRFWYAGTVGEVEGNIIQHFEDLRIIHLEREPDYLSIYRILEAIEKKKKKGERDESIHNIAGDFMKSILSGTPYPYTLLMAAVRRMRAERKVTYPRVAVVKAVLVRNERYYNKHSKEVGMTLDRENSNPGYLLGRLFAVLEKIQEEANPGINVTIRDRFYGAASSTPATVFPLLMRLKNYHLSKMENRGRVVNLEKLIGEIIGGIREFPHHLNIEDQGRFAVGYYHQRQDFFTKSE